MSTTVKSVLSTDTMSTTGPEVRATVEAIITDVRERGGLAVRAYSEKFENWGPPSFRLTEAQLTTTIPAVVEADPISRTALGRLVEEEVGQARVAMLQMPGLTAADIDLSAGMVAR